MSSSPPHVALDQSLGLNYVAVLVAASLYGVSCVQAWYYFVHQKDAWPIKTLVSAVMICDTIHQALLCHTIYVPLITDHGNFLALERLPWSMFASIAVTGLIGLLVQGFFNVRIWRLSRNVWLTGFIFIVSFTGFCFSIFFAGLLLDARNESGWSPLKARSIGMRKLLYTIHWIYFVVDVLQAACDVLITASLCTLLYRCRGGFHRSNIMINKLLLYAVNTGCFTSTFAFCAVIFGITSPKTAIPGIFYFSLPRLYTNSLLATLNGRESILAAGLYNGTSEIIVEGLSTRSRIPGISVNVSTQKELVTGGDGQRSRDHDWPSTGIDDKQAS